MRRALAIGLCLLAAGCGGGEASEDPVERVPEPARDQVREAQQVSAADFPAVEGRGLEELAGEFETGGGEQATLGTSEFVTGTNRLAFGVLNPDLKFVYGKTVVYVAPPDGGAARGPFPAPADVLITEPRYRSEQAATEDAPFAAVYSTEVPFKKTGIWNVLVATRLADGRTIGSTLDLEVIPPREDDIPAVGEEVPKVETDTLASVKGDEALLDTRTPAAPELHETSFKDVVGKKPVALLFATPQLCQSRVCGPVVDIMLQLRAKYGDQMEFIHQEVFKDNNLEAGLRRPLIEFGLDTEPWLFTIRKDGTVAARLEGSFGLNDFEKALEAAL